MANKPEHTAVDMMELKPLLSPGSSRGAGDSNIDEDDLALPGPSHVTGDSNMDQDQWRLVTSNMGRRLPCIPRGTATDQDNSPSSGPSLGDCGNNSDDYDFTRLWPSDDSTSDTSSVSSLDSPLDSLDDEPTPALNPCDELCNAIKENDSLRVKRLLSENKSHLEWKYKHGRNPLHLATKLRHKQCVQVILKIVSDEEVCKIINEKEEKNEESPLHIAVRIGWVKGVCLLLEANADITAKDKNGKTVLHLALSTKKSPKKVATEEEKKAILEKLLEHEKCNEIINLVDKNNQSPLFFGITLGSKAKQKNRNIELVELLIKNEADIHIKDRESRSALFLAVETKQPEIVNLLIEKEKLLIKKDKIENTDAQGKLKNYLEEDFDTSQIKGAALHIAVYKGCAKCVKLLLDAGCDISKTAWLNEKEVNVFHLAAQLKDDDVMSVLVKHLKKMKEEKQQLLKEIFEHLNLKSLNLNKIPPNNRSINSETLLNDNQLKIDKIDEELKIANKSKLRNDPSIWKYNSSANSSASEQPSVQVVCDKLLTIKNNSEAILNLLNKKAELLDKRYDLLSTPLAGSANGLSQVTDIKKLVDVHDTHISHLKEKVSRIDHSCNLLNVQEINISSEKGRTPLQIACENSCRENIKLLIQAGADLTVTCNNAVRPHTTLMDMIIHCVPSSVDLFKEVFDSSIELKKEYVEVDFKVLLPDNTEKDNFKIMNAFLSTGNKLEQQMLLDHPLVHSFLQLQWEKLKIFYLCLISVYTLFVLSLNWLLYTRYIAANRDPFSENASVVLTGFSIFVLIFYVEICYFSHSIKIVYEKQRTEMCIKACCYIIAIVLMFTDPPRECAVIVVCLSLFEFTYLLSHIPQYGTYMLIFIELTSAYFIVILSFSFIIIQFMFVFMVLFRQDKSPFNTLSDSLTKIVVMMTGELEYEALFETFRPTAGNVYSLYFVQFVMIAFILLIGTVLVNLLIEKAVIEINKIDRIRIQATSMIIYDRIFFDECKCNWFSRTVHTSVICLIKVIEYMLSLVKRLLCVCCNANRELLSEQLFKNGLTVFKLQLNIVDRSSSDIPISDNVVNLILSQGFINNKKIREKYRKEERLEQERNLKKAEKKELLDEIKNIVLVTVGEVIKQSKVLERNGDRFKKVVSTMMANKNNIEKLAEKEMLLNEIKSTVTACIKAEISNLARDSKLS